MRLYPQYKEYPLDNWKKLVIQGKYKLDATDKQSHFPLDRLVKVGQKIELKGGIWVMLLSCISIAPLDFDIETLALGYGRRQFVEET